MCLVIEITLRQGENVKGERMGAQKGIAILIW